MSCSDYIPKRWLLQQWVNSKQRNFATETKEARKAGPVALQNNGFPAFVTYPFIHSSDTYYVPTLSWAVLRLVGTVWSQFLTTKTTDTEDQLGPLHGIPLTPSPLNPGRKKTMMPKLVSWEAGFWKQLFSSPSSQSNYFWETVKSLNIPLTRQHLCSLQNVGLAKTVKRKHFQLGDSEG